MFHVEQQDNPSYGKGRVVFVVLAVGKGMFPSKKIHFLLSR